MSNKTNRQPRRKCAQCGKQRVRDESTKLCTAECLPASEDYNLVQDGEMTIEEFSEKHPNSPDAVQPKRQFKTKPKPIDGEHVPDRGFDIGDQVLYPHYNSVRQGTVHRVRGADMLIKTAKDDKGPAFVYRLVRRVTKVAGDAPAPVPAPEGDEVKADA